MNTPERRFKRFKVDIRVRIRRADELEENSSVVRTYELSEGGMSVYASETFEVGTMMVAELALPPNQNALQLHAVVRNRRGFRCGLEFVDLPAAERAEIVRYAASLVDIIEI